MIKIIQYDNIKYNIKYNKIVYYTNLYYIILSKDVRCNPDIAPRLTSGGYEDKVDGITPANILFIGGGEF